MRILLVSTYELGHQPLHVASPAARLRDRGIDVSVLDVAIDSWSGSHLVDVDAVAISVPMHTATRLAAELVPAIRRARPELPIALYGLYAGMGSDDVDRRIVGEYEEALVDWALSVPGDRPVAGTTLHISQQRFQPPERRSLPGLDRYAHLEIGDDHRVVGYTEASHGCRHRCRHCPLPAVYDGRYRVVQPAVVLADVAGLVEAGARHITFGDPDFFNGVPHAMRVLEAVNERFGDVTIDITVKVEHLLAERARLGELVERNVLFVTSAFETTNDTVLTLLDKGHTRADMVELLTIARRAGLDIHPSWLPFTPWTSIEDVADIFSFIDRFDLFEVTDPVQLTIRLLVPRGSLVLDIPGVADVLGPYDPVALTHTWQSADPRVDALQRRLAARAEVAAERGDPLEITLTDMRSMALEAVGVAGTPQIPQGAIVGRPRLTEPWFC